VSNREENIETQLLRMEAEIADLERAVSYYRDLADEVASYNVQVDSEVIMLKRNLDEKRLGYQILLALHEIIGSSIDIDSFFASTLELILTTLKMDRVAVLWSISGKPNTFKAKWHLGYSEEEVKTSFAEPFDLKPINEAVKSELLFNRSTRKTEFEQDLCNRLLLPFLVGTRIQNKGKTVGWLIAGREKEALPFYPPLMPENVATFEVMAGFVKATYFNFQLYNNLEKANARLENYNQELEQKVIERTRDIEESRKDLEIEKNKSDELLLNILPADVAEELKENGYYSAKRLDEISILFTDFVDFTKHAESMSPEDLVSDLDDCFRAFDNIITKYGLEKIKTIGDSYMAAGGVIHSEDHEGVRNVILAGMEMQKFVMTEFHSHSRTLKEPFHMRLGINTGPVVAGIVGVKKFQYDIWGDTVNTASRMESNGMVGKVNISLNTYNFVKNLPEFEFEARGKIEVKGKGEIEMYFVSLREGFKL
jgi:class 3 adenylate cyclase